MNNRVPQGAIERLEPDDAKVSRPVLRGGGGGNTASLPGDPLYRLVEADYSDGHYYGYGYDRVGNRTVYTDTLGEATAYDYDRADRLITVTYAAVATPYSWSDRGELLSDGMQQYQWDAAGRLVAVSGPDDLAVGYAYNGDGQRTRMVVGGVTTTYVVDPYSRVDGVSQVIEEKTAGESIRYLYGLDLLAQQQGGTTYLGHDAQSLRLHLDSSGDIVAAYRYGPFGETIGEEPEGYGYSGERWDGYIKFTYLRARYYSPLVGRFVSRDPLRGSFDQPGTLQRYVYVLNRPLNLVDPSGMQAQCPSPRLWDIWLYLPHFYNTRNERWDEDIMRTCGTTIRAEGCLLTSATMVFSYYGSTMNPGDVNRCMGRHACPWDWAWGANYCSHNKAVDLGRVWRRAPSEPSDNLILAALLAEGIPPIVSVGGHWVVVYRVKGTGLDSRDYWIADPTGGVSMLLSSRPAWTQLAIYGRRFRPPVTIPPGIR